MKNDQKKMRRKKTPADIRNENECAAQTAIFLQNEQRSEKWKIIIIFRQNKSLPFFPERNKRRARFWQLNRRKLPS